MTIRWPTSPQSLESRGVSEPVKSSAEDPGVRAGRDYTDRRTRAMKGDFASMQVMRAHRGRRLADVDDRLGAQTENGGAADVLNRTTSPWPWFEQRFEEVFLDLKLLDPRRIVRNDVNGRFGHLDIVRHPLMPTRV